MIFYGTDTDHFYTCMNVLIPVFKIHKHTHTIFLMIANVVRHYSINAETRT